MTRMNIRTLLAFAGVLLLLTAVFADNIFSREQPGHFLKGVPMENYMGLSVSGKQERATFALG